MGRADGCFRAVSAVALSCSAAAVAWCLVYGLEFAAAVWGMSLLLCVLSYPPWVGRRQPERSRYWAVYTVGPAAFFLFVSVAYSALVEFDSASLLASMPLGLMTYRGMCGVLYELTQDPQYVRRMV